LTGARFCTDVPRCHAPGINNHLSELWTSLNRSHADRRVRVLLRMQRLRRSAAAFAGGLLRFLFVWRLAVPADPRGAGGRRQRQMLRCGLNVGAHSGSTRQIDLISHSQSATGSHSPPLMVSATRLSRKATQWHPSLAGSSTKATN
jgi:hypothetical protein